MRERVNPPLPSQALRTARQLRQASTAAEVELWYHLRGGRMLGLKFRRQHPVPPYVADFCCLEARLVVDLDGSQHAEDVDLERTQALQARGFEVLRF
ncbi:MAG: endonuclease domain-containing protein [Pseudomarimonas sp.]